MDEDYDHKAVCLRGVLACCILGFDHEERFIDYNGHGKGHGKGHDECDDNGHGKGHVNAPNNAPDNGHGKGRDNGHGKCRYNGDENGKKSCLLYTSDAADES